jgi:hypothetical protein
MTDTLNNRPVPTAAHAHAKKFTPVRAGRSARLLALRSFCTTMMTEDCAEEARAAQLASVRTKVKHAPPNSSRAARAGI